MMKAQAILFSLFFVAAIQVGGCGGAQKGDGGSLENCRSELARIQEKEEVCDPILFERFEKEVVDWEKLCTKYAQPSEKRQVEAKVSRSRECSELKRLEGQRKEQCSSKVYEMAGREECWGEACKPNLEELDTIIADCSKLGMDSGAAELAASLRSELKRKYDEEKRTKESLAILEKECLAAKESLDQTKTEEALDRMLAELERNKELEIVIPEESPIAESRSTILASCGYVLKRATQAYSILVSKELGDRGLRKKPEEWAPRYRKLEESYQRLQKVRASELFPGSVLPLKEPLEKFRAQKENQEKAEEKRLVANAQRALKKGASQCKKLNKKRKRFETKIASYTKKGNQKKVDAYQTQLDKNTEELAKLNDDIQRGLEMNALPEKRLESLLKSLEKAGCPAQKISITAPAAKAPEEKKAQPAAEKAEKPEKPEMKEPEEKKAEPAAEESEKAEKPQEPETKEPEKKQPEPDKKEKDEPKAGDIMLESPW